MFWAAVANCFIRTASGDGTEFFETKIRPVLVKKCYSCHSAEAAAERSLKGGLQLDTRAGIRAGGESGPAVVPRDTQKSLLLDSIRRETFEMPPDEKLPQQVIDDFTKWIQMGAPDPREGQPVVVRDGINYEHARRHWAYQPLSEVNLPAVRDSDWPAGSIDRFILGSIERAGLQPAGDASPLTILRRLSFDLTGLPPSLEQVRHFESVSEDAAANEYKKLINQLLESPRFGEHWARHWLDGIRYNPGLETSAYYRNWVIRALNEDLPYNEFLRWQIAGDLLDLPETQRADAFVATQFLAYNGREDDYVESTLEVIGQQIFGISFNCGKCHDHKFDAFSQNDYYSLAGIFTSTEVPKNGRDGRRIPGTESQVITVIDREEKHVGDTYFLLGGDRSRRGDIVSRKLPQVFFVGEPPRVGTETHSGRLELADWVGRSDNVLAARVIVNRLWQWTVGRGIVRTPNDFGTQGDIPTHPELLEYLATRLIEENWSLKAVIREITLSRVYRLSVEQSADIIAQDETNQYFSRGIPKRLQFEQIMDNLLAVAGKLELGEIAPVAHISKFPKQRRRDKSYGGPRTIYCRNDDPVLKVLDGPDPELLSPDRARSVTAPQALMFLNSDMVRRLAEDTAKRIESADPTKQKEQRIVTAYRILFSRTPTREELQPGLQFIENQGFRNYIHTLMCLNEFIHLN